MDIYLYILYIYIDCVFHNDNKENLTQRHTDNRRNLLIANCNELLQMNIPRKDKNVLFTQLLVNNQVKTNDIPFSGITKANF